MISATPLLRPFSPERLAIPSRTILKGEKHHFTRHTETVPALPTLIHVCYARYNATISGPSGNITVNGTATFGAGAPPPLSKRGLGEAGLKGADVNNPPYAIHNGNGPLLSHTLATNATHAPGFIELDTHNMWGLMEEKVGSVF